MKTRILIVGLLAVVVIGGCCWRSDHRDLERDYRDAISLAAQFWQIAKDVDSYEFSAQGGVLIDVLEECRRQRAATQPAETTDTKVSDD